MKAIVRRWVLACLAAVALAGCGGGGGDGDDGGGRAAEPQRSVPQRATGPSWLSFTPDRIDLETKLYRSKEFSFKATSTRVLPSRFYVQVRSERNVFKQSLQTDRQTADSFVVEMETDFSLGKGVHTGVFEISLCEDFSFRECEKPLDSPWQMPYRISVSD